MIFRVTDIKNVTDDIGVTDITDDIGVADIKKVMDDIGRYRH